MQTRKQYTKRMSTKTGTHLTNCIHWFSHPVAPLSVLETCKQVIVVGWAWLPDRSYKDHGNINWYISYSSWARLRWQCESCCHKEWSISAFIYDMAVRWDLISSRFSQSLWAVSHNSQWQTLWRKSVLGWLVVYIYSLTPCMMLKWCIWTILGAHTGIYKGLKL